MVFFVWITLSVRQLNSQLIYIFSQTIRQPISESDGETVIHRKSIVEYSKIVSWIVSQTDSCETNSEAAGQQTVTLLFTLHIFKQDSQHMTCLIYSNPPVPCPAGMYSLGGKFDNCTACPAGSACPDPAGAPVACTGGKKFLCQSRSALSCLRPALLIGYLVGFSAYADRTDRSLMVSSIHIVDF